MKSDETSAYSAHAAHCSHQAGLVKDDRLKKFWSDLADDWIALENTVSAVKVCEKALPPR